MRHPSVLQSQHTFAQVPQAHIERSSFDRSHGYKTTFDEGYLIPVFVDEVLPGDTFNLRMSAFCRLSTPVRPLMDNLYLDSFFFFVPNRLLWTNWQKFNGEQTNPGDSTSFVVPYSDSPAGPGYAELSLQDYLGLPVKVGGVRHNVLHTRAYNLIWNQWFRDENLQNSVTVDVGDGPDTPANYVLLKRGKRHDYFTSCLPWPQKGTAVSLPLGTTAPVSGNITRVNNATYWDVYDSGTNNKGSAGTHLTVDAGNAGRLYTTTNASLDPRGQLALTGAVADLSTATAATINSLRQAFQIQRMYERDARGGTRYTEIVRSHFGVVSPDARLQRAEYLGGGSTPVNVHPVVSTSNSAAPLGSLAGMGTGVVRADGFTKSFTEHGVLIGLVCVRADLNYQQGLNRMWSRSSRFDFFWPALAHLGEQAVLSKEIYADGTAGDSDVFGYQERYAEYRYKPSLVTGRFRSSAATPVDVWHLAQNFAARPTLNAAFIVEAPPVTRVVAVPTEPHFFLDCYFKLNCVRPMPVYSVPGLTDHF